MSDIPFRVEEKLVSPMLSASNCLFFFFFLFVCFVSEGESLGSAGKKTYTCDELCFVRPHMTFAGLTRC